MKNYLLQRLITSITLFLYAGGVFAWENTHSLSLPNTSYLAESDSTSNPENDMVIEGQLTADGDSIYQYKYKVFDFGEVIYNKSASSNSKRASKARKSSELNISLQKASTDFSGKYVGKIPFTENVSPSGGKVYTIPIITAPGCSFAPQISLTYNSQSGNGVAGYGWNITGVSAINIVGRSIYYDGVTGPIDLSQPDSCGFALDGVRLVSNQGKLTEYQYETAQGFILVKKHLYGGNVAYFTVAYPNGSVATFGFTGNTKTQYTYPLTEITDLKGWKTHFSYIESGNHYFLTKISYGGRNINNHPAEIQLNYEDRSDFTTAYISGKPLALNKLLKSIVSFNNVNGSLQELCTYTLTHELKDVNRLIQLDCSSEGSSLSPLKFAYNFYQYGETNSIQKIDRLFLARYFSWKCNIRRGKFVKNQYGDGLIAYPSRFDTYTQVCITAKPKLFGSTKYYPTYGSAFPAEQDILIAPGLTFFSDVKTIKAESGFQTIEAVDVDGDGVDEIVKVNFGDLSGSNTMLKITVYKNSDQALTSYTFTVPVRGVVSCEGVTYSPISRLYYFGDFMGTGKAQLLTVSHNKAFTGEDMTSYFALIDLDAKSKISETELFSVGLNNSADILPLDMDGDGKLELCHLSMAGMDVYRFSNKQFIKSYTTSTINKSYSGEKLMFGDMNGDGKIDILVSPEAAKEKIISIPIPVWAPHDCPICKGFEPIIKTDPERDNFCRYNKCDVRAFFVKNLYRAKCRVCNTQLIYDSDELYCPAHGIVGPSENISLGYENGDSNWGVYLSTGKGFIKSNISLMKNKPGDKFFLMDINNDGNADLLHLREQKLALFLNKNGVIQSSIVDTISIPKNIEILPANVSNYYSMSHFITVEGPQIICYKFDKDSSKDNLLTALTDSYGNIYRNEYADMTDGYSSTTTSYYYPYFSYIGPLNLLRISGIYTSNYKPQKQYYYRYYGAVMHRTGLGFTGFEKISTYEDIEDVETVEIHNPKIFGVTTQIETPTKLITNSYSQDSFSNKKNNPRIIATSETNKLTNVSIETNYESFDEYNNPTTVKTTYGDLSKLETTVEQHFNHVITSNRYIIGQLSFKEIVQKRNQEYWHTGKELYYNKNNLLQSCINYAIEYDTKRTYWEYDSNGNVISEKSALYNVKDPLGDCYTYDSSGRYLITKTNALGQTTTYSNFDKWGHPCTITDYKNRVTTLVTDSWGNVLSTTSPDGITETTTTAWGGQGLYTITKTVTGKPTTIVHYDVWEREIRKGNQRFDGQWQFVDNVYDEKGRLEKVSLPFRGSAATYWNTYTYDKYNRPTLLTEASGKTTSWSYNGLSTTETKNGIATTKTYDETGALVKVEDPGGSIVYTLRADGQPKKITAPGNAITSFEYDEYGRKSAIIDPSAGKQTFTENYNADGTCISTVTDAQGRIITTTTDKYGRVTNANKPEFSTTYTYNEDGQVKQEKYSNGGFKSFEYDKYGRLVYSIEGEYSIEGKNGIETKITYDQGNISSIEYLPVSNPFGANFTENYIYKNGCNTEIKVNDDKSIWKLVEENDLGQPTKVVTGPLERTYSYTVFGLPTRRTVGNIQDFSYNFDTHTGNLLSRTDNTRHITETFKYDQLNRLNQIGTQQVEYTDNGNIIRMPDVGAMTYGNTAKPYQVTSLTPMGISVPVRDQQITYTSFQRPDSIMENGYTAFFNYDAEGERTSMTLKKGSDYISTKYYVSAKYESDDNYVERLYLGGDAYDAPAVCINNYGELFIYYIARDNLGSITHIFNEDGALEQELSYDAWGRLRNPDTQEVYAPDKEPELFLGRGYTGHEHLPWFGLINMNARLYDPVLGRFLSPDPYVQMPDGTQSYNRYSYCMNNPLVYVDKDGKFWHIVIGAAIGSIANLLANWNNIEGFWDGFTTFITGAVAGGATAATGGAAGAGFWTVAGVSAAGGAVVGINNSIVAQTDKNFSGFNQMNWKEVGIGGIVGGISGFAGGGAGYWAASSSVLVNNISSPVLRSAIVSPLASGAGHVAGGTTYGLLEGQNLGMAFSNSFSGIGKDMLIGGAIGVASTIGVSYASGINPWTGEIITHSPNINFDFTPDPNGNNITLYRGTTGSEGRGGPLFMTDNPQYAATYVQNGGRIVRIVIPRSTLFSLEQGGYLSTYRGIHGTYYGYEYKFSPEIAPYIIKKLNVK